MESNLELGWAKLRGLIPELRLGT
eukprot:COSAG06_NODE_38903_length_418_cov_0.962382_1_plen_23_part_10